MSVGSGRTDSSAVPMGNRGRLRQHPKPGNAVFMQSAAGSKTVWHSKAILLSSFNKALGCPLLRDLLPRLKPKGFWSSSSGFLLAMGVERE